MPALYTFAWTKIYFSAAQQRPLSVQDVNVHYKIYLPFDGCRFCLVPCRYRDRIDSVAYKPEAGHDFRKALSASTQRQNWGEVFQTCQAAIRPLGLDEDPNAAYCYFVHLFGLPVTETLRNNFLRAHSKGG